MDVILDLLLFVVLIPVSWQQEWRPPQPQTRTGCTQEFDSLKCMAKVYCEQSISYFNIYDLSSNAHGCSPEQEFNYNGHYFGETQYTFKHFSNVYSELNNRDIGYIVTKLDLSNNELTDISLPQLPRLKTLNFSGNLLTTANLYSSDSELNILRDIDLSYNRINTIKVDRSFHVFRSLTKINLSNNYLVLIQDGIFYSFPELEYVDLSYNYIETISILTFEGLTNVIYLSLKHNRLSKIGAYFARFNKLKELDLSENKIENINYVDFEKLISLSILDLHSNFIKNFENNVFNNNILIKILNLSNNLLDKISKEMFTNLTLLENIDLSQNKLKRLPKDVFKDKQLSNFSVTENKLEGSLVKGMFEGIKLVTELDLSNQQLETIEANAFYGLHNLKILLLNSNKINTLSKKSFNTLRSLENLDLSSNRLSNIEFDKYDLVSLTSLILHNNILSNIKKDFFDSLYNLQFLDLSSNQISSLEDNSFKSLKDLISFQISNNPISGTIEQGTFNGLTSLPSLDISGTSLTSIKNSSFNGMTQLKELNVSHSDINDLEYNSFLHTGIIETIDLSFNKLSDFNINTTELGSLVKLFLNNNQLKHLSTTCFKGMQRLTNMIIAHNQLETIPEKAFDDQKDVRYLDLSYNSHLELNILIFKQTQSFVKLMLSGIPSNISFSSVEKLRVSRLEMSYSNIRNVTSLVLKKIYDLDDLVLSNNNITKLDSAALNGVKSLKLLDLSYNKITFIQPGALKDNTLLRFLNVSHNMLTTVSYGIFRGLIHLDTVDFSFNEITDLQSERFYEVHSLAILIADHNKIQNIKADEFSGTNLKSLSIGNNPISCHILVNLKKDVTFEITAISLEESSDHENVDGVTCNMDRSVAESKYDTVPYDHLPNEKLLLDIREILHNMSLSKSPGTSVVSVANNDSIILNTISEKIDDGKSKLELHLSNTSLLLQKISSINTNTNALLDRMLKVLTAANTISKMEPIPVPRIAKENDTMDNFLIYINKIKSDLADKIEASVAVEKQNILNEIDDKISDKLTILTSKDSAQSTAISHHEALSSSSSSDSKSLIFIEVCVVLMLVTMFACFVFILLKYKNSGIFAPSRHTTSTRHLTDSIENSAL